MASTTSISTLMEWIVYLFIIFLILIVILWIKRRWRVYPKRRYHHCRQRKPKWPLSSADFSERATWKEKVAVSVINDHELKPVDHHVDNTTTIQKGVRWVDDSVSTAEKSISSLWSSMNTSLQQSSVRVISEPEQFYGAESIFFSRTKDTANVMQIYVGYGLNYSGDNRLQTCWNDLRAHYDWWDQTIRVPAPEQKVYTYILTDNPQPFYTSSQLQSSNNQVVTRLLPTISSAKRVHDEITRLARKQHDLGGKTEIVYYFSGHGYKRHTWDTKEIDGQMECIVLSDGLYWDYEMTNTLCKPLPSSTHLFAKFDSCHSGTVMNSRYTLNPLSGDSYQTSPYQYDANIWVMSGCADYTTSNSGPTPSDQSAFTRNLLSRNESINILPQIRSLGSQKTFIDLYYQVRENLRSNGERQIPEFSCSHRELFFIPFFPSSA